MSGAAVLHVAAHGVHHTENPMFSSLRLEDGVLFAHELDQTVRAPEHVVLSACELGLATVRPGDEALGLTSVLLRLGARSVVAGIARVGDDVAAETMIDYHKRLAAGADSAAALAEATADRAAPFVCFGATWRLR
jgi:CHAT domain-containing protein